MTLVLAHYLVLRNFWLAVVLVSESEALSFKLKSLILLAGIMWTEPQTSLESGFKKMRFRWVNSLVSCGRKADSGKKGMRLQKYLQSRTKVLRTVLQYSYFSVISRFPLKTVHPFRNFLAVLLSTNLYKVETRKKICIHASNIVCKGGWGGGGRGWTRVNWKMTQKRKSVPRRLSLILDSCECGLN